MYRRKIPRNEGFSLREINKKFLIKEVLFDLFDLISFDVSILRFKTGMYIVSRYSNMRFLGLFDG